MDLNHRRAFSLLLYQLSYNRIRYSAYKANCTLSSEPRIIDKSYYVTPFGVVLPAGCEPAIHHWHSLLRRTCMLSTTVAYQSCLSSSQPSFRFAKPFHPISSRLDRAGGRDRGTRTLTRKNWNLKPARLPIPPYPHITRLSEPPLLTQVTPLLQTPCSTCGYLHHRRLPHR